MYKLGFEEAEEPKIKFQHLMGHGESKGVASLKAQLVKNLPAMQETLVQFLGQEDPLAKE